MRPRVVEKRRRQSGGIAMQIQMRANQDRGVRPVRRFSFTSNAVNKLESKSTQLRSQKIMHQLGASWKSTLTPFTPLRAYSVLWGIWLPSGMQRISCKCSLVNWTAFKAIFNWKGRMFPSNSKCTSKEPHGKNNPRFKETGPASSFHRLCI